MASRPFQGLSGVMLTVHRPFCDLMSGRVLIGEKTVPISTHYKAAGFWVSTRKFKQYSVITTLYFNKLTLNYVIKCPNTQCLEKCWVTGSHVCNKDSPVSLRNLLPTVYALSHVPKEASPAPFKQRGTTEHPIPDPRGVPRGKPCLVPNLGA